MIKVYLSVALFASGFYPLAWSIFLPAAIPLIYGDLFLGALATVGIAVGGTLALLLMRYLSASVHDLLRGMIVRLIGAALAGLFAASILYLWMGWAGGWVFPRQSVDWWVIMSTPGLVATFTAYWVVHLFVGSILESSSKDRRQTQHDRSR